LKFLPLAPGAPVRAPLGAREPEKPELGIVSSLVIGTTSKVVLT
jgi:hypothetical protein